MKWQHPSKTHKRGEVGIQTSVTASDLLISAFLRTLFSLSIHFYFSSHFLFTSISPLLFLLYHTFCQNYYIFAYFSLLNLFLQPINENIYNCAILWWRASKVILQGKFRKQSINNPHMFKSIIQFICLAQNCLNLTILSQPPARPCSPLASNNE